MSLKNDSLNRRMDGSSGSPNSGEPVFLVIGRLRRPHGVAGEINMEVLTDFPDRIQKGAVLLVGKSHRELVLESARPHGKGLLIRFAGINDPESVGLLRNELVYKAAANLPKLPTDEFYHHDLLGMQVFLEDGQLLGVLQEIIETGANDVYRVETEDGKEVLLPAIESVIMNINTDEGRMIVRLQEWL